MRVIIEKYVVMRFALFEKRAPKLYGGERRTSRRFPLPYCHDKSGCKGAQLSVKAVKEAKTDV